jgi:hypothetical protein
MPMDPVQVPAGRGSPSWRSSQEERVYATCLFCQQPLGGNESIEAFPIGRRLAFDAERGRLWVVCRKCERWNLSPIEERWEAIESCERLFRDTGTRVSTEQVGLARLGEGLELVRIGRPLRPEFAAWRYGDQFGRRRRRTIMLGTGVAVAIGAAVGGVAFGGVLTGVIGSGVIIQSPSLVNLFNLLRYRHTRLKLRTEDGRMIKLRILDLQGTRITSGARPGGLLLSIFHGKRREMFRGQEAERAAGVILPSLNNSGGNKGTVQDAVSQIEARGSSENFLHSTIQVALPPVWENGRTGLIASLPKATRLALEMALHEESERRALEGELNILEEAWREAEEVARISDDLILPPGTGEFIEKIKADL